MKTLFKKPIFIFWIILLLFTITLLATKGLFFGVDFNGGTSFQIVLEEPVSSEQLTKISSVIDKRLNWSGSKDTKVTPSGDQYLVASIAESDPDEIASLKEILLRQGTFEAVLESEVLFSGDEITIIKDPQKGYGFQEIPSSNGAYRWTLPLILTNSATNRFAEMVFHKCVPIGYSNGSEEYDCANTFFFVDRPKDTLIMMDSELYFQEKQVPTALEISSSYIPIEDLFSELTVPYFIVDSNLTDKQLVDLKNNFVNFKKIIISPNVSLSIISSLEDIGYKIILKEKEEGVPWIWTATGLKSVISITEGIANMDVPTMDSSRFQTFTNLTITGQASSYDDAVSRLDYLDLIITSGSLPIAIESISTESISPYLGSSFLNTSLWIGILALITVAIVLFFRYKQIKLVIPILITGTSEILILLGFLSLLSFRLDLAAVAGILATIGTGVDDNIIIIDELLKGRSKNKNEYSSSDSLIRRIKKAFFIMFAAAATTAVTMIPIFGLGLGKLTGFAVTILLGTAIGVFITRPVYAQIAKKIVSKL
ncbi:MAG: hypothetical protein PHR26_01335 [Candidatus ainarchaeum sp.]|nr:hypothetical protein [Candidatus ainarchaeum sp.]MDD3975832.1 hypothetical protein [Candidatus ainarchaeum sp.]